MLAEGDHDNTHPNKPKAGRTALQEYEERPEDLLDTTLFEFCERHDLQRGSKNPTYIHSKDNHRLLNYYPRYEVEANDRTKYEDYCCPYFFPSDGDKERPFYRWSNAYEYCQIGGECPKDHGQDDYYGDIPDGDLDEFEQPERPVEGDPAYFQEVVNGNAIRDEDPDNLGDREMDRAANWAWKINTYIEHPEIHDNAEVDWWEHQKQENPIDYAVQSQSTAEIERLNPLQRQVFDMVLRHYSNLREGRNPEALRINIDGPAGTGKSFLIDLLSARLQQAVANENQPNPIQRLAPTGSAAHNINGSIVHSYLSIPIDSRLRQACPSRKDDWFGGYSFFMFGDFFQLPPVGEKPLFHNAPSKEPEVDGKQAYDSIDQTLALTAIVRQEGDEQAPFREVLPALRTGQATLQHWALLSTRV
ncbi:unnamed protein product [Zymoseptoria tritici ST99CH_1A5]|uniref:ATP-dependent DNA helicase n=1 Tax=Zymoseptoria tritici ST99CH_1A5 TaxID=1276529 RepID=A0A1Y6M043_ZYMTR|nr:unnamed protein product [Zymoseptoria tritici ST99CH_3D1]SMY30035.1 unnamed protein product [Zymoseptoria tritici ST99CH_1A5]